MMIKTIKNKRLTQQKKSAEKITENINKNGLHKKSHN
jgi:hypothetical protein